MGLDQYFFIKNKDEESEEDRYTKILYFRKFYELNEWVAENLVDKYDINTDFNCEYIPIQEDDIKNLHLSLFKEIQDYNDGNTFNFEEKWEDLYREIERLKSIEKDNEIYYYAWW